MISGFRRARLLGLVTGGCLCAVATTAGAVGPIGCGSTLTKSTTLTADIVNCPGTAARDRRRRHHSQPRRHTISGTNAADNDIANDGRAGVAR